MEKKVKIYEMSGKDGNIPYDELTILLNKAYQDLYGMGLNYGAATQTADVTRARIGDGNCIVAEYEGKIVGTISYNIVEPGEDRRWYEDDKYLYFNQFAIDPDYRDKDVIMHLGMYIHTMTKKDTTIQSVMADTSEQAEHLVKTYTKYMGMQIVDYIKWPGTNYNSYVFRRQIHGRKLSKAECEKHLKQSKQKLWWKRLLRR